MKVIVFILVAVVCFSSCRNETDSKVNDRDSLSTATSIESTEGISDPLYTVEYDEKTQGLNLVRGDETITGVDAADVVRVMNKKYEGIKLDLVDSGKDTIAVKIDDATKLSQGMGSMGAEAYLAELTFSMTELEGVKAVKIDFEEGDHAMPGVYTRADFKDLIKPVVKK